MAKIAGYHLTWSIDQGDAWVNAVDSKTETGVVHKECAWNNEALDPSELEDLRRIGFEEAQQQCLICGYCNQPLTNKQYYAFQPEYDVREALKAVLG